MTGMVLPGTELDDLLSESGIKFGAICGFGKNEARLDQTFYAIEIQSTEVQRKLKKTFYCGSKQGLILHSTFIKLEEYASFRYLLHFH